MGIYDYLRHLKFRAVAGLPNKEEVGRVAWRPVTAHSAKVLVIDDSPLCRDIVGKGLRSGGFEVTALGDGPSGLQQLETIAPDVILLDNEMPQMNGLEFLRALRAQQQWATLPVIMLTSTNARDMILEAIKLKISGYVLKEK